MYQPGGLKEGIYISMNHSYFYLKHCEEGSAELDQLVFEDDLED